MTELAKEKRRDKGGRQKKLHLQTQISDLQNVRTGTAKERAAVRHLQSLEDDEDWLDEADYPCLQKLLCATPKSPSNVPPLPVGQIRHFPVDAYRKWDESGHSDLRRWSSHRDGDEGEHYTSIERTISLSILSDNGKDDAEEQIALQRNAWMLERLAKLSATAELREKVNQSFNTPLKKSPLPPEAASQVVRTVNVISPALEETADALFPKVNRLIAKRTVAHANGMSGSQTERTQRDRPPRQKILPYVVAPASKLHVNEDAWAKYSKARRKESRKSFPGVNAPHWNAESISPRPALGFPLALNLISLHNHKPANSQSARDASGRDIRAIFRESPRKHLRAPEDIWESQFHESGSQPIVAHPPKVKTEGQRKRDERSMRHTAARALKSVQHRA